MKIAQQRRAQQESTSAPTGGLNARDSLALMPPNDAVTLTNFFPTPTSVNLRSGYTKWSTGYPAAIESLMSYNSASANSLFAASGTAFYDATNAGVVGGAVVSGLTNARWQHINVGTPGGQFLLAVNGSDKLRGYNGTSWWTDGDGAHDITGVDTSTCIHINLYKNRVYLVQNNSFSVWYLPLNSIAGAASKLDLSPLFKLGGYLMGMITYTIGGSYAIQEYAAFVSSEGEIAMYQGSDPSASGWGIVGMFRIGRPIGRRFFSKFGADIILITADGFFPMSKALVVDRSNEEEAISSKIINLVNNDVQAYAANYGWDICLYPIGNKLIINVPQTEKKTQYQYVMNTITTAWCKFTGWNANCFAVLKDSLYFGGNLGTPNTGYVAKADTGFSDAGAFIFGEAKTAFQYFGQPAVKKRFTMARPIYSSAGTMKVALSVDVDFQDIQPTATPTFTGSAGTAWNTAPWNTFAWGTPSGIHKDWQSVNGIGTCAALHMKMVNNASSVQWQSVDYLFEVGGIL